MHVLMSYIYFCPMDVALEEIIVLNRLVGDGSLMKVEVTVIDIIISGYCRCAVALLGSSNL